MREYRLFWREFRQNFSTTGAILPSGRPLARTLARLVRLDQPNLRVLEVGPGTGAVTREIVAALPPDARLDLVEANQGFVDWLEQLRRSDRQLAALGDRLTIHHCFAQDLPGAAQYDVIVSGLPLNNFEPDVVRAILAALRRQLAPGGTLSFFEYIAVRRVRAAISGPCRRRRLQGIGAAIDEILANHEIARDRVLKNVPPAWVHHVRFAGAPATAAETASTAK
jgi:phosphatidylethanolamine/phosphatidyl-N-methylethanolamine N-methyltransferase